MLAQTTMLSHEELAEEIGWRPDVRGPHYIGGGTDLAEFAGRACYQSWGRPNPKTATNRGYLENIIRTGHFSVLEHASVTFYIEGVSRSLTHELVRHRHLSYSQLSQRYVPVRRSGLNVVEPAAIAEDSELHHMFLSATNEAEVAYDALKTGLERKFADLPEGTGKKKAARQAARAVLPNATETKIVVTGNYRAWWEFMLLRAAEPADVEIRALAVEILRQLQGEAGEIFDHFEIVELEDGTEIARRRDQAADGDKFRVALSFALGTPMPLPDEELLSYALSAIAHAQTLPPPVRSGETVTHADPVGEG